MRKKEQLIVSRDDHDTILGYIRTGLNNYTLNLHEAEAMKAEMKKAKLVDPKDLPQDVVCLNSVVTVKQEDSDKVLEITLVTPDKADIRQRRISILSPIATALIGFSKGSHVSWRVPGGVKKFNILEVRKEGRWEMADSR